MPRFMSNIFLCLFRFDYFFLPFQMNLTAFPPLQKCLPEFQMKATKNRLHAQQKIKVHKCKLN